MRPFHPAYIFQVIPTLLPYLRVTLLIVVATVFFGGLFGALLAFLKIRCGMVGKLIANFYIYITRCVPSIVMLFIIYYGLPEFLKQFGVDINNASKATFVIATYSVLFAATIAEVFRAALEAVEAGQREAGVSIGLSGFQTFRRIILPQATVYAIPNFTNAFVNLLKEGSLAYTIGLIDIMGKGKLMIGINQGGYALEIYLALGIIYWIVIILLERAFAVLEKRLSRGRRSV